MTPDYFNTLRIHLERGAVSPIRMPPDPTVAIVNQVLARFWPGRIIGTSRFHANPGRWWASRDDEAPIFEYLPSHLHSQRPNPSFLRTLSVRSSAPIDDVRLRVEREIAALEPELPVADAKSLDEMIGGNIGFVLFRVGAWQATSMGVLGLALAIIGVYGVVSYQTTQREKEIGIRMALGAVPWDVRRLVLRQGVAMVLVGVAIGLVVTLVATTVMGRMIACQHHGPDRSSPSRRPRHRRARSVLPAGQAGDEGGAGDGAETGVRSRNDVGNDR